MQWLIPCLLVAQSGDFCNFYIRSGFDSECVITSYKPNTSPHPNYEEHECLVACRGSQVIYSIVGLPSGASYDWAVSGADSYTTNTSDNTITVNWSETAGIGTLILSVYGQDDEFCEKQLCVDLVERPVAGILSNPVEIGYTPSGARYIDVCDGQEIQFYDNSTSVPESPVVGYYWDDGIRTASTQNFTFTADYGTYGSYVCITHMVVNECGCEDVEKYIVNISKYPQLKVDCFGTACENTSATYHATSSCSDYMWYVDGGHIQDGQGTGSLTVMWDNIVNGYGYIALDGTACGQEVCPYLTYLPIPVISDNAEIQGPDIVCVGDIVTFELPQWASTEYNWSVNPSGSNYVRDRYSGHPHKYLLEFRTPGTYTISCNYNCTFLECGGVAQTKTVTVTKPFGIISDREACAGESVTFETDYPTEVFDWTIYHNGTSIYTQTASTISYTFNTAGGYTIEASSPNFCNTAYASININALPPTPLPDVSGWANRVCIGNGYTYSAEPDAPEYYLHWSATCGQPSQFDGNDYNVTIQSPLCNIELYYIDRNTNCMSHYPYEYQLAQFVPQTITWPTYNECANEEFTMSVTPENGVLLEWDMIATNMASIVSDRFASTVTIQTNGTSGTFYMLLKRIYCNTYTYDTIPVIIKPYIIPEISMPKNICQYSTVTISAGNTEQIFGTWTLEIEGHTYTYTGLPSGATWNYTFNNSGTIPVSLSFSADGCTQTYETIETVNIIVAPQFSLSFHEIIRDTLYELNATVLEPNAIGYTYNWSNGYHTQQFQHNGAYFSYSCTVIDNSTGCSNSKTVSRPQPTGCRVDEGVVSMSGSCTSRTFVNNSSGNIFWSFEQNASSPQFTTSGTNNNTCNATFTDAGYYRVYSWYVNNGCSYMKELEFCIPLIARMSIEYSCPTGSNIYLELTNTSDFMLGTTINSETWYVDGILVSNPSNCAVTSGTHTITLTVNYSGSVGSGSCTTSQTVTYNRGTAAFTVSPGPYCSETGIQFTDNSTNAVYWYWTFNDGNPLGTNYSQNPEQSFVNNTGSGLYVSTNLLIEDNMGCTSSATTTLMINPNTLRGSISADPVAVCYGNPWTINFNHDGTPTANPVYHWYESNQTTTVNRNDFYETGSYYVRVTNDQGCVEQSDWENICFKSVPVAQISGDADYCPDGEITLIGESGDNTYQWSGIGSNPITTPNLTATIASYALSPGNYTVTLTVTKNGCSSTDTKTITIHPAPATPSIGFGANICLHNPPVNLISTASQNLHWSTGDFGTATETYNSGFHTAYYTDPTTGCRSADAEIDVPKPPDFNELMSGCFEFCKQDLPRYVLGPWGCFDYWKWHTSSMLLRAGTGTISRLDVPVFDTYNLDVAYAGSCFATSGDLDVRQKEFCDSCNVEIELIKDPWCDVKDCKLHVFFYLDINNLASGMATLVGATSPSIGTLYTPALPLPIGPMSHATVLFEAELSNYEPQNMLLELRFYDGVGNPCVTNYFIDLSDVLEQCIEKECPVMVAAVDYMSMLSTSGMSYFQYVFHTSAGMSNVHLYSDDITIIDVNYNPTTGDIIGILAITPLGLQELISDGRNLCFKFYGCYQGEICKHEFCIPASYLQIIGSKSVSAEDDSEAETGEVPNMDEPFATDFCLYPNPATSSVSISGDNFSRATVIDMGGKIVMKVYDTTFNIGTLRNGEYIVKVISLDGAIQYLKLIKR